MFVKGLFADINDLLRSKWVWEMTFTDWGGNKVYLLLWNKEILNLVGKCSESNIKTLEVLSGVFDGELMIINCFC